MTPVTQLGGGPDFRFTQQLKQGDRLEIAFVIGGYASLVGHAWRAQMRGPASRLIGSLGVSLTLTTVTTPNDSLRVVLVAGGATTSTMKPGVYVIDCEDVTAERTWASGTIEVLRDWSR